MKILHAIIALFFIFVGLALYTTKSATTQALIALLISNVSLAAISIEIALDKSPVERTPTDRDDA